MSQTELLAQAAQHLYENYRPAPVVMARGEGTSLYDVEGRRYLDLCAGVAVCALGHGHKKLTQAIAEQAARVMHVSNYFYNDRNIELAAALTARTKMARAFFCNSGAEANEALLKLARHHHFARGDKARTRVVAFLNAFHGRTLGALSMTGTAKYREGFGELGAVTHVPYGDAKAVADAMGPDVAAIIVEPLQGEGGVLAPPRGFLTELRRLATAHGALLLIDEVQTGLGRTGTFLGHESDGPDVCPDAISLAKGLGGGFPIGAMLTTEALRGALPPGTHGSTFGGNPLACAAALAVLAALDEEDLIAGAARKGEFLSHELKRVVADLPAVCEGERGLGLLRGLVLRPGFVARDVLPKLQAAGVLLTAAGERVLRFSPPLVVTEGELKEGVATVRRVLGELPAAGRS